MQNIDKEIQASIADGFNMDSLCYDIFGEQYDRLNEQCIQLMEELGLDSVKETTHPIELLKPSLFENVVGGCIQKKLSDAIENKNYGDYYIDSSINLLDSLTLEISYSIWMFEEYSIPFIKLCGIEDVDLPRVATVVYLFGAIRTMEDVVQDSFEYLVKDYTGGKHEWLRQLINNKGIEATYTIRDGRYTVRLSISKKYNKLNEEANDGELEQLIQLIYCYPDVESLTYERNIIEKASEYYSSYDRVKNLIVTKARPAIRQELMEALRCYESYKNETVISTFSSDALIFNLDDYNEIISSRGDYHMLTVDGSTSIGLRSMNQESIRSNIANTVNRIKNVDSIYEKLNKLLQ